MPFDAPKPASQGPDGPLPGSVAEAARAWAGRPDGASGFVPIGRGNDALGARLRLIEAAAHTIDAQYFLIKRDHAGALFIDLLHAAAERGVRVRLLVDDILSSARDTDLALLERHPNAEVRLFNPLPRAGLFAVLREARRINRRMHHKALIVDGAIAKVGGRNIGDEYYGVGEGATFADFDVLAAGPVVAGLSRSFDAFWNSPHAVPLTALAPRAVADGPGIRTVRAGLSPETVARARAIYHAALASQLLQDLASGALAPLPGRARVVSDPPEKIAAEAGPDAAVLNAALSEALDVAEREVLLVTPYFIPLAPDIAALEGLVARGVAVVVITNSLASNNHPYTHGPYARARDRLLAAGVRFYEADAGSLPRGLTLHTKAVVVDARTVLVGSMNLDPRSLRINAELGIFVESPALADAIEGDLRANLPRHAFRVELGPDGRAVWRKPDGGAGRSWRSDPGAGWLRRLIARVAALLPIESQL